ncbi:hypothetical protein J2X65_003132 [Ancylobacter sp. 3268]|uniref:DUF982 domain-containing protein n=1 Tax=Ancylobacter sp. 3268 TaxID=2817752 RepID=UPI0028570A6E|nr:DUF982 domain-containing protein [Ancylobacter sp. 3268]MDR6953769.1 hypothetical protein [Ancylobacter sp. 3268]
MQPVSVWESDAVKRTFTDVEGAARFLLERWPTRIDTDLHRAARQAALEAMNGVIFVADFRAAFVAAAEEAGILA